MTKSSSPSTVANKQQPQNQQQVDFIHNNKRPSNLEIKTNIKDKKAKKETEGTKASAHVTSKSIVKKTPTVPANKSSKMSTFPASPMLQATAAPPTQQQAQPQQQKQVLQTVQICTKTGKKNVVETEIDTSKDVELLQRAIALSKEHMLAGHGGPFGAVIADSKTGEIIVDGWNVVTSTNDPTGHAEVTAIRRACAKLGKFQLSGMTAYSSCEPCPMCMAALYWARVDRVVFANDRKDAAKIDFDDNLIYDEINIPYEKRTIPFQQIPLKEGVAVFDLWAERAGKVAY